MTTPCPTDPSWDTVAGEWSIRSDTIYLNHGSFGPAPREVHAARVFWQRRMDEQPMDFFVRQFEPAWRSARDALARFVGARPANLVFVENATAAMNVVARSLALRPGDRVVLTNHEYGAVRRIWEHACRRSAADMVVVDLPEPLETHDQIVAAISKSLDDRTRLLVVSHITSPTALHLPIEAICRAAAARGVPVCVDGPHAPLHVPLDLESLGGAFYTASCHKWLCAPFGSGFLYVAPAWQRDVEPLVRSWGRLLPEEPQSWDEQFIWSGTRDPSALLAVPAAIDFFQRLGLDQVRARLYDLADYARQRLIETFGTRPLAPASATWYGAMAHVPLPGGDARHLQQTLWDSERIEVPIIDWLGQRYVRVSSHLYNAPAQVDRLVAGIQRHVG